MRAMKTGPWLSLTLGVLLVFSPGVEAQKAKGKAKAKAELTYPPRLPGGKTVVTDTEAALLTKIVCPFT